MYLRLVLKEALDRLVKSGTTPATPLLNQSAWDNAIKLRRQLGDLKSAGGYAQNVDMKFAQNAENKAESH